MYTLDQIDDLLTKTTKDLFGDDIDGVERDLLAACHPDRHDGSKRAERLFKAVQAAAERARQPAIIIPGAKHKYGIESQLAVGDAADVHLAVADGNRYVLKASRVPGAENLMKAEYDALAAIHGKAKDQHYRHYFPMPVETFLAHDRFRRRINVFAYDDGFWTLAQVLERHKTLDGRHLAWIFKRLTTAIGFADVCGLVHGAILPEHIVISPNNHGVRLVGWGQSVAKNRPITTISAKYRDWYPPEVLAKKPATSETDIYMAAKCALHLCQDPPREVATFLRACLLPGQAMRPNDAWALHEEFDELLRRLYGPPKFHVLTMKIGRAHV